MRMKDHVRIVSEQVPADDWAVLKKAVVSHRSSDGPW